MTAFFVFLFCLVGTLAVLVVSALVALALLLTHHDEPAHKREFDLQ